MTTVLPPCERCRAAMAPKTEPVTGGMRRHAGNGICDACAKAEQRSGGPQLRYRPAPWTEQALCAQTDPEIFFPEKGGSTAEAKAVCRACPVRTECLTEALENEERFGIFGGMSERERRKLAKRAAA